MGHGGLFGVTQIASSGLAAERMRMEVAANNIANANSTRTADGTPYRRQQVVFSAAMKQAMGGNTSHQGLTGVVIEGVEDDLSEMPRLHSPGHPDADAEGYVTYPNVKLPHEMVDMMTAARAYEANLKSLQIFRSMTEQSLSLLKGS
ncbi:Flagellar basal-body rod protein FlgC [Caulifigura coniformis]|uniref:Flagellar basal-body rod protein FlgC n=1 Tax=Caulifigura coniformis TaxID=2527983 RepID=A0A517SJK7_9PLAN|nr:flagellar basal body rod protein FlgC [Caulifigura coniformis]QDT56309.1 Flagellar basal-body rod protein FlgC [Caulifigura coniformis]